MAGVLQETETAYPCRTPVFTPGRLEGVGPCCSCTTAVHKTTR